MAPGYFPSGRAGGRRRQKDTALLTLLLPLAHHVARLPNKPPVTLGLVALMVGLYLQLPGFDFVPPTAAACLQPRLVLEGREWGRLLWSGLLHADDMHLYYNMASFLWKGVVLEPAIGSARFAALVAELLLASQALLTVIAAGLSAAAPALFRGSYASTCAIGFSGVLFALKVVLNARSPDMETIYGVRVPAKYVAWVELVVISLVTPNASFLGHLAGILAGLLHVTFLDRGTGATPGDGFSDRARRQLRRLVGRFRRSFTGVQCMQI